MEYICTNEETIKTGSNIETVRESKLNPHDIQNDSESIHLNNIIDVGKLFIPTSKNINTANRVLNIIEPHVIYWAPVTPIYLPKNPDIIEPKIGKIINDKYITNIL
jgi:hypothetical protein